jgi:hypothetical protein
MKAATRRYPNLIVWEKMDFSRVGFLPTDISLRVLEIALDQHIPSESMAAWRNSKHQDSKSFM